MLNASDNENKNRAYFEGQILSSCLHPNTEARNLALVLHFPLSVSYSKDIQWGFSKETAALKFSLFFCLSGDLRSSTVPNWFPLSLNPHVIKGACLPLACLPPLLLLSEIVWFSKTWIPPHTHTNVFLLFYLGFSSITCLPLQRHSGHFLDKCQDLFLQ